MKIICSNYIVNARLYINIPYPNQILFKFYFKILFSIFAIIKQHVKLYKPYQPNNNTSRTYCGIFYVYILFFRCTTGNKKKQTSPKTLITNKLQIFTNEKTGTKYPLQETKQEQLEQNRHGYHLLTFYPIN